MFQLFKRHLADDATFYTLLILLVAITSFGLGRWSSVEPTAVSQPAAVATESRRSLEVTRETSVVNSNDSTSEPQLVASKNGSKYHYLWCPGAQQMNDENKIFFDSVAEAEAAGYEPAANCKGL